MKKLIYLGLMILAVMAGCKKDNPAASVQLTIKDFFPVSGNPGTVVTIRGTGFGRDLNANAVAFNGTAARVLNVNDTMLVVQAPDKGTTGKITVTAHEQTVNGNVYTYQALSVHQLSPANGPEGTNVYISGAGLAGTDGPATVTINGKPAIVSNANDTLLVVVIPPGAGSGPLEIAVNGQKTVSPAFTFQAIGSIKPLKGGAGTNVTITGTGFSSNLPDNIVAFNGVNAKVVSATATSIVVTAPTGVQTGPVSVTINGQKTAGPVFTVVPAPTVKSVAPLSGPVGTVITITGKDFSELKEENNITINGVQLTISSASATQLTAVIPAAATTGPVALNVNNQMVTGPVFTVQSLGVSQLLPDNGLAGSIVVMKGTGFSTTIAQNQVTINGLTVQVNAATDTTLTVQMPVGVTTGTLNVKVGTLSATGPVFRRAGVEVFYTGTWGNAPSSHMVFDSKGNMFVGINAKIGRIAPDGTATAFAGSDNTGNQDGTGTAALFSNIGGLGIDAQDNLYVADAWNGSIRKITPAGEVSTYYQGITFSPRFVSTDAAGNVYFGSEYNGYFKLNPGATQMTQVGRVNGNAQFVVNNGKIFYANTDGHTIQQIVMSTGMISTFAGAYWQDGYVDGPANQARMNNPAGIVFDPVSGMFYFNDASNFSIRAFAPDGTVSTITGAAGSYQPWMSGNVNGTLKDALFGMNQSSGIAVDKAGNIYIYEQRYSQIRKIILQ
ncbi:MAG: IPT/TIG domain-containing protein [Chitinophaga sp.]|uniref:IPT/TIG domain-containing protein n=1 Tax=Chitinophaga sp. TaxID=1869181 RepID=UPI0025BD87E4|nr:IPT/TIG domain-containing protein [Chitinophaga sp.]MBV8251823.1 IPT/TIG domain-containing protein [Chitinophaga sp.]